MNEIEIEKIEIEILQDALLKRYGYDFSDYVNASFKRRLRSFLEIKNLKNFAQLIPLLLHNESEFGEFMENLSVSVTDMYRDPKVFKLLIEKVFPYLKTYPSIRIWHAGCATGEEVYSLAILLKEANLYDRTMIYATDFSNQVLKLAKEGIYPIRDIKAYSLDYQKAGGTHSLSDYYHAEYNHIKVDSTLRKNITFANHNLVADQVFGEMHLILCRNVLIYFNQTLQNRALDLFDESLIHRGFLCLGTKESLRFSNIQDTYTELETNSRIFQKD